MAKFQIANIRTSLILGTYEAETPALALEAMAVAAGYDSHAQAERVSPTREGDLTVTDSSGKIEEYAQSVLAEVLADVSGNSETTIEGWLEDGAGSIMDTFAQINWIKAEAGRADLPEWVEACDKDRDIWFFVMKRLGELLKAALPFRYYIAVTGPHMPTMARSATEEIVGAGTSHDTALANAIYFSGGDFSREDFVVKPCTKSLHDAAVAAGEKAYALRYVDGLADIYID